MNIRKSALYKRTIGLMVSLVVGAVLPISPVFAQNAVDVTSGHNGGCESLMVLDFLADASGKTMKAGEVVGAQYRLWGVGVSAMSTDGMPKVPRVQEFGTSEGGPVFALEVPGGNGGVITFLFNNLYSVQAVELIGLEIDGTYVDVYDQNSPLPAVVPVTPAAADAVTGIDLSNLGPATRLDAHLAPGSAVAKVILCPESSPKSVPRQMAPKLTLEVETNKKSLNAGEIGDITMIVRNIGGSVGFDVTINQDLPPGLVFADDGETSRGWDLGAIGANGSFTVPYQVRATGMKSTTDVVSYVVSSISNGRGADGVASAKVNMTIRAGRVLATQTSSPTPKPQPTVTPTPAKETPSTPAGNPTPVPTSIPTPTPTVEIPPIGGPIDGVEAPGVTLVEPTTTDFNTDTQEPEEGSQYPLIIGTSSATTTATTTGAFGSCTSWIWLLALVNAVLVGMLAQRERKAGPQAPQSRWVVAMLLVAVPMIIWYPGCELSWWLAITAVGSGVMLSTVRPPQTPSGEITAPPDVSPPGRLGT